MGRRKRAYRKGSIYCDKRGQWWYAPPPKDGERVPAVRCASEQAAKEEQQKELTSRSLGVDSRGGRQSVHDFLTTWYNEAAVPNVKPKTAAFYQQMLELYILPAIGAYRLDRLQPEHILRMLNELREDLSPRTVRHVYSVLRQALDRAVKWRKIPYNPAAAVDPPKVAHVEQTPFTVEQTRTLLEAVAAHRLAALYHVALILGLRKGELIGLRWADVDLAAATMKITQQIVEVGGKPTISTPKSEGSKRTLPLSAGLVSLLRAHWQNQQEERALLDTAWKEHGLVFASEVGTPLLQGNLSRQFKSILDRAGLPDIRFHDLRHTAATRLGESGAPWHVIQAILGHGPRDVTGRYTHVTLAAMREAVEKAERTLLRAA